LTTFNGVVSSLEKDSTRLADGLGEDREGLTLLLLLLEGRGEKLPGALAGPRAGCILGWILVKGVSHLRPGLSLDPSLVVLESISKNLGAEGLDI